jgi:hypothetical protein
MKEIEKITKEKELLEEELFDYKETLYDTLHILRTLVNKYVDMEQIKDENLKNGIEYVLSEKNIKKWEVNRND